MCLLQAAYLKIDNCSSKSVLEYLHHYKNLVLKISVTNRTNEKCIFLKKFNFINILF